MRPAFSLILFTSLSGLGFGLAAILGLRLISAPNVLWQAGFHATAMGLIGAGLVASTFHLGHPERTWRALSQWRSSWLSREGVVAGVTFGLLGLYALDAFLTGTGRPWLGAVVAGLSLVTIWCTAMIYASLKTVARWYHPLTPFVFIGYAIAGGFVLATALDTMANAGRSSMVEFTLTALIASTFIAIIWSRRAGADGSGSSPESATGLGHLGEVKMIVPPHTEENWLQHEMGFVVARKHADMLRRISLLMALILPVLGITFMSEETGVLIMVVLSHTLGVMISRWLFFAEAKHTVMLYYGQRH